MLIDAANGCDGWTDLITAVRSNRAFAVDVRREIVALDDDESGGDRSRAIIEAFGEIPFVLLRSGQVGRYHAFARIDDEHLRSAVVREARRLKLDVRFTIRPPLTAHRVSGASVLQEPAGLTTALTP